MAQRSKVPYLKWNNSRLTYLMYLSNGVDPSRIPDMLPTDDVDADNHPVLGVSSRTVEGWRRDTEFKAAIDAILNDPDWFHTNVAVPYQINQQDRRRMEASLLSGKPMESLNGKELDLLLQERGHINDKNDNGSSDDFARGLITGSRLVPATPATHDVTPALGAITIVDGEVLHVR